MNLIDELDDNPTPAVGTPSDSKVESGKGEVTSQDNLKQAQEPDKYVLLLYMYTCLSIWFFMHF